MSEFTAEMIRKAASGDQDAIAGLYELTYSSVYKTVKSMIADEDAVMDILQDSYIKGFQSLSQLDTPENFRAWMKQIAVNKAKDYLKKRKPILFTDLENEDGEAFEFQDDCLDHCPEEVLDRKETARLMQEILSTLSEDQRLVIGMFYYEEMSVREIAETLGCSENTVKSRLNYGRKKVEAQVKELEKRGVKLYSLAPLPFLLWLLHMDAEVAEAPSGAALEAITAKCTAAAVGGGSVGASGMAGASFVAGAGVKTAAGLGTKALIIKIIAGVLAVSVLGGGAVIAITVNQWLEKLPWHQTKPSETTIPATTEEATADTVRQETEIPQTTASEDYLDRILKDIQTALTISTADYEADMAYYDSQYSHLGEGVMWILMHRKVDIYTMCIMNTYLDIDGDGQDELCVARAKSPSGAIPTVIYKQNGEIIYGDAIYAYIDLFYDLAPTEWDFLAG